MTALASLRTLQPLRTLVAARTLAPIYIGGVLVSHSQHIIAATTSHVSPAAVLLRVITPNTPFPLSWIGWVATAVFVCSYFAKSASRLRMTQAVAALLWMLYGVAIGAMPVIVANVIVAIAAGYSSLRHRDKSPAADMPHKATFAGGESSPVREM